MTFAFLHTTVNYQSEESQDHTKHTTGTTGFILRTESA